MLGHAAYAAAMFGGGGLLRVLAASMGARATGATGPVRGRTTVCAMAALASGETRQDPANEHAPIIRIGPEVDAPDITVP